jgi:tetratricopeptide (TPR) repeat protein
MPMGTSLVGEAEQLVEAASADARSVLASDLVDRARLAGDRVAEAIGLRAMGLAAANLDQVDRALEFCALASAVSGLPEVVTLGILNTYGAVLAWSGQSKLGESVLTDVIARSRGAMRAQALVQRGAIRFRLSEFASALDDFDDAETLGTASTPLTRALLHTNRGLTLVMLARVEEAIASLEQARTAYRRMEAPLAAAAALHNLGWAAGRRGDIPQALEYFDEAEEEVRAIGGGLGELWRDRADLLSSAGLTNDAIDLAKRAVEELEREGHRAAQAEALVRLAETALGHGDVATAATAATDAGALFRTQQRVGWTAHAELIALQCRFAAGRAGRMELRRARSLSRQLHHALMRDSAVAAEILAARIATRLGDTEQASRILNHLDVNSGRLDMRVGARLARAELDLRQGTPTKSLHHVRLGLAEVDRYRAAVGSSEVRAHLSSLVIELGNLGLRLVWKGSARRLLLWLERTRAGALRFPPARPPDDGAMGSDLARLRAVESRLRDGDEQALPTLRRRRSQIEERVRRRDMRAKGPDRGRAVATVSELADALDDRRLIALAAVDDELMAISILDGKVRRHELGRFAPVRSATDEMRLALVRLASQHSSERSREAARQSADDVLMRLDKAVMSRIPGSPRATVLVPPVELQAFPWSLLPTMSGTPLSVSPSGGVWMAAALHERSATTGVTLAAGAGLDHSLSEVRALARIHPTATILTPSKATVAAVAGAIAGNRLAHLACHGTVRTDNPLFSSLRFKDGGLTVYDLEEVPAPPQWLVLSACSLGQSAPRPGDEPLGVVAALLGMGGQAVIASPTLVPDSNVTRRLMVDLHRRLTSGHTPAVALAAAQEKLDPSDPSQLVAGTFMCFGAG